MVSVNCQPGCAKPPIMKPSPGTYFVALFLTGALLWTTLGAADDGHSSEGNHSSGGSSSGGRSAASGGSGQDGGENSAPQSSASSRSDLPGSLGIIPSGQASRDAGDAGPDQARELVARGLIRPLQEILVEVRNKAPGDIVGITLAQRKGHWVYGFKVLTGAGRRLEITVDARTMALLSTRP